MLQSVVGTVQWLVVGGLLLGGLLVYLPLLGYFCSKMVAAGWIKGRRLAGTQSKSAECGELPKFDPPTYSPKNDHVRN